MTSSSDDILGQLTVTPDGAVVSSSGSLQNNERLGQTITKCIQILSASPLEEPFKRISFLYSDHCYVVFKSAKTLKIVHKKVEEDIPLDLYIPPSL